MQKSISRIIYKVMQSRLFPNGYVVEGIDHADDGQIYTALFSGPLAKLRADEYAHFKNKSWEHGAGSPGTGDSWRGLDLAGSIDGS